MRDNMSRLVAFILVAAVAANGSDSVWSGGSGTWTNTAAWSGGAVPGAGDTASFLGSGGTITVPAEYPFNLSALFVNTNGVYGNWVLTGATNTLAEPAEVRVDGVLGAGKLTVSSVLTGTDGLKKTGTGFLELAVSNNLFQGQVMVAGGTLRAWTDGSLGTVPGSPVSDAILLDGGTLINLQATALVVSANRGVTVGPGNGWLLARNASATVIDGKVTGPGAVFVARNSGTVVFNNSGNDYAGDTTLGADCTSAATDSGSRALLQLGANEVIPHGAGQGRLVFDGTRGGLLDLNGKTETVNTVAAVGELCLSNSAAQPGVLRAGLDDGNMVLFGEIPARATLEKTGAGRLIFADNGNSRGGLTVTAGALDFSRGSSLGALTVTLDGGSLSLTNRQPGLVESMAKMPNHLINLGVAMTETAVRLGTAMGNTPVVSYPDFTQFGYKGQWYVPSAGTYSFAKNFDNSAYLAIDGVTVISNNNYLDVIVVRNVGLTAGWHTVDVRFSEASLPAGPNVAGFTSGIMYDPANGPFTNAAEIAASAKRFEDPGDGSLLRTSEMSGTNVIRAHLELAQDGTLDRSATAVPLVWAGDVVTAANAVGTPVLTVAGGAEPFRMGATNRPAVFGADVSDTNGVVFQDKVWLLKTPASSAWSIRPGAEITVGAPGLLGTGPMSLTNFSVRIPSSDALGSGGETVTVEGTGNAVWFDATRETDGRLTDDPAYAFTASNNVVFNGAGARAGFDGAGTVTYSGAISGSGALVKNGTGDAVLAGAASSFSGNVQVNAGRLRVGDDAQLGDSANTVTLSGGYLGNSTGAEVTLARNVQVNAGGFDVQDAALTMNGVVGGTTDKRGGGTLSLEGVAANTTLDLSVTQGAAVLNKSGVPAVRNLNVSTGAAARLAGSGGNQISGAVTLTGGLLDMNGFSETIGRLNSAMLASTVTNGTASASVLTVGEGGAGSTFFGGLADGAGGGTVGLTKTGTNTFTLAGAAGSQTASGGLRVEGGTLALGAGLRYVRFTPLMTKVGGSMPAIGEFQLLRDGEPVGWPAGTLATAASWHVSFPPSRLIDSNSKSSWLASAAVTSFTVTMPATVLFNGYRWCTADGNTWASDPVTWTVEVSADNTSWLLADARANQTITAERSALAGVYAFNGAWPCDAVSAATSAYVASGAVMRPTLLQESVAGLTGSGEVALTGGAALRVADAGTFAGTVSGVGRLLLGGNAALSVPSAAALVTAVNDGTAPAAVTIGGAGPSQFAGALADGTAALGLTKRGSGTLALFDAGSTYTGDTRVEEGVLSAQAPVLNFRYVRFSPTQTVRGSADTYGIWFSMSEFQLMRNGQAVAYPAGTTVSTPGGYFSTYTPANAVNGLTGPTTADRWLSTAMPNPLTIDMKSGVQFDSYRWYTAVENDNTRLPIAWTVEGSNDKVTWTPLDSQSGAVMPWVAGTAVAVGPFALRPVRCKLPADFWAETNTAALKLSAVSARYLRFTPTVTRWQSPDFGNTGFQLSELQLLANGAPVLYPAGTTATAPGGSYFYAESGTYPYPESMAVDNVLPLGPSDNNRWYSDAMVNPLTVNMGRQVVFSGYRWYTGPNAPGRDPLSWTLEVSNNATNWYLVDVRTNQTVGAARNALAGTWTLDLPAGQSAADTIPDASRTDVASGAGLRIDAGSETVGPLSGTGTVTLVNGAAFGINGFADAAFAGGVTGTGTVTKTGAAVQTLSGALTFKGSMAVDAGVLNLEGAVLTGVTNIVIRSGGELAGSAAVNGNLTVTFEGGVYSGMLAMSGALTVVGDVVYGLPEGAELPYTRTLFTFGSADAATRAALAAGAASVPVPFGYAANVRVTSGAAYLSVAPPGMVLKLR